MRGPRLLQQALSLCDELRAFGNSLLLALDEGDAQQLELLRQRHARSMTKLVRSTRFLQWKEAQTDTEAVLASRDAVLARSRDSNALEHYGRQVLTAMLREQLTKNEYESQLGHVESSEKAEGIGELSRLYLECYKLAFDIAKRAEQTLKRELMRPELDGHDFIARRWDSSRAGFRAAESLFHDLERLEQAYLEQRRREHRLTKHISLAHLDPTALAELETTGRCEFTVPESLFELDSPGQYMRRLETVAISLAGVAGGVGGPGSGIHCKLSLVHSSIRLEGTNDSVRDFLGPIESVVTSSEPADDDVPDLDSGDEYYLPFAGAGASGTWRLELPRDTPQLDLGAISDVVLHLRYTARTPDGATPHS